MSMRRKAGVAIIATAVTVLGAVSGNLVVHRTQEQQPPTTRVAKPTHFSEINATQRFRYQAVHNASHKWGQKRQLPGNMRVIRHAMVKHAGNGYQLKPPGKQTTWSQKRTLKDALGRLRQGVHNGGVWRIRPMHRNPATWKTRRIDIDPAKYARTEGTLAVDIIVGSTFHQFPNLNLVGIYQCRTILGTNTLSQHAYGNAADISGSVALMDKVARWQYNMAKKGWLPISQLLYRGHDWFSGSGVYDHFNHIHDSGKPLLSGGCRKPGYTAVRTPLEPIGAWPLEGGEEGG